MDDRICIDIKNKFKKIKKYYFIIIFKKIPPLVRLCLHQSLWFLIKLLAPPPFKTPSRLIVSDIKTSQHALKIPCQVLNFIEKSMEHSAISLSPSFPIITGTKQGPHQLLLDQSSQAFYLQKNRTPGRATRPFLGWAIHNHKFDMRCMVDLHGSFIAVYAASMDMTAYCAIDGIGETFLAMWPDVISCACTSKTRDLSVEDWWSQATWEFAVYVSNYIGRKICYDWKSLSLIDEGPGDLESALA